MTLESNALAIDNTAPDLPAGYRNGCQALRPLVGTRSGTVLGRGRSSTLHLDRQEITAELDMEDKHDNGNEDFASDNPTDISLVRRVFGREHISAAMRALDLLVSDQIKFYRAKCLIDIGKKLDEICATRGINPNDGRKLAMRIGLPLLERASYQDNDYLQSRWAHLLAATLHEDAAGSSGYGMDICQIEALHQFEELDCRVLEHIVETGVVGKSDDGAWKMRQSSANDITKQFPGEHSHLALDKLAALGCIERVVPQMLGAREITGGYGSWGQEIFPTLLGISLYIVSSGKTPAWLEE